MYNLNKITQSSDEYKKIIQQLKIFMNANLKIEASQLIL